MVGNGQCTLCVSKNATETLLLFFFNFLKRGPALRTAALKISVKDPFWLVFIRYVTTPCYPSMPQYSSNIRLNMQMQNLTLGDPFAFLISCLIVFMTIYLCLQDHHYSADKVSASSLSVTLKTVLATLSISTRLSPLVHRSPSLSMIAHLVL